MNFFKDGWFTEYCPELWKGSALSLEVEEVLYNQKSAFQDILVFQSKNHGRVLVLDGIIQCTEFDEFCYQEMIAHTPLFCHDNPEYILVIGGGDGGVLREVAKHSSVKEIHICEIDEDVITVSKKFIPSMAVGFEDPRVKVHIEDGNEFMRRHKNNFDIIITDSSDPIGPAASLFKEPYYENIKEALKPRGTLCSQGETMLLDLNLISRVITQCRKLFPSAEYATSYVPTYPLGQIGYFVCSKDSDYSVKVPKRKITNSQVEEMKLKYYNSEIHEASFVLPQFVKKRLE